MHTTTKYAAKCTTIIYLNGLGAFESMAVQCGRRVQIGGKAYCNRRDCDNETVNRGVVWQQQRYCAKLCRRSEQMGEQ
jgi:hypothetical protein